jgi:predicted ATPase/class 3 adenylate cyclase
MFCDLVGSTALSQQLDPEELRTVILAYRETCASAISRFGGYLAKYIGDGLLVYFGYPQAHEDDAQRAVRAGLEIVTAIRGQGARGGGQGNPHALNAPLSQPLQVRIGIHTGLVVAGEMGVGDQPEPLAIVGETPNIAARLQEKALPNSVVISPATHRLITGLFECQDLGPQSLKGISTPLSVYRVVGESAAQSRFEVAVGTGLTPLVGREEELEVLQRRWAQAKAGTGQVVMLSGEAGIGKSRLVQALKEQVSAEGATRIEFRCSPYHQNSALYPIIDHLQRLLQFQREETLPAKLAKLQQALAAYRFPQADTRPLLATLLSLPQPEGMPPLTLSPQKQKQKTQETLVAWLLEEAERAVVYCAWEDLHWADPSTLEFLTLFLEQIPTSRVFAVLTFRPDFIPPWNPRSYLSQLALNHLGRTQVEAMVENVTGGKALPSEVLQQIVAKTDGVPLFVEELTKMVLESGLLREEDGRYVGAHSSAPLSPLAIPSTLQDSLMARLDRLAPVREIAQVGAVLGREFSYELIHAVSRLEESTLQQGLRQLVDAELIYQRGLPPQAAYLFKHALIQDTAYQSLLKSKRQQLHQQTARMLAERFPETAETQPELLAHHYTAAGLSEQAIPYWQRAGQRASQYSAYGEAVNHLTKGLELLKMLPDMPERLSQELSLQSAFGPVLIATKGWAAPETHATYTRTRDLAEQLGETMQLFRSLRGIVSAYILEGKLQEARDLGEQLLILAERDQDPTLLLEAHNTLGFASLYLGESIPARAQLEQGVALYNPQQHALGRPRSLQSAQDPGVAGRAHLSFPLWFLGYPDQALQRSREALSLSRELSHPFSLVYALCLFALLRSFRREGQAAHELAEEVIRLSHDQGFSLWWLGNGMSVRGWTLVEQGQIPEGVAQICQGIAAIRAAGTELVIPYYLALLAEAYGKVGQTSEGLQALTEALCIVDKRAERVWEAELYRLKGKLTLQSNGQNQEAKVKEAEEYFYIALDVARQQEAKLWELRAATSLARLWQQQGKKKEAGHLLSEIYHWFTEGFNTPDLQEAKALLDGLA